MEMSTEGGRGKPTRPNQHVGVTLPYTLLEKHVCLPTNTPSGVGGVREHHPYIFYEE